MNDIYLTSLLMDFYGDLLTNRQYEVLDLHINNDYSLSEIAERLKISRQGVHDNVKRGISTLHELEDKLDLVEKHILKQKKLDLILNNFDIIEKKIDNNELRDSIIEVKNEIIDLIKY